MLPQLAAASIDAVITDPPYVLGAGSSTKARTSHVDAMNSAHWFAAWYRMAARVLAVHGSLWTFANWRTLPVVLSAAGTAGLDVTSTAVWDKRWISTGGPRSLRARYELCVLMPQPAFRVRDRAAADVWPIQGSSHKPHGHPAEKPLPLLSHVLALADVGPDGLVLDPFMGAGTTLAAARARGVPAIGIDAEERWCAVTAGRIADLGPGTGSAAA